jgi:hypothetical protein|tara:strand:+ start:5310 stop:6164 length:855 start_codon:yes stop_codon:yes gene_type:complete
MSLRPVIDSLDQVDESLRSHYVGDSDGKFTLQLDGQISGTVDQKTHNEQLNKVAEFRDNNLALIAERNELKSLADKVTAFGSITPEQATAAISQIKELEGKGVKKGSDVQMIIDAALKQFKDTEFRAIQQKLEATDSARQAAESKVIEQAMAGSIGRAFKAAGGQDEAQPFIVSRAREKFEMADGLLKAKQGHYSIERPGEPLPLSEWIASQTKEVGFAFGKSNGTGTPPGAGEISMSTLPSGVKLLVDPTPQELGQYGAEISSGKMRVVTAEEAAGVNASVRG